MLLLFSPRYPDFEKEDVWVETYVRPCNFLSHGDLRFPRSLIKRRAGVSPARLFSEIRNDFSFKL